MKRRLFVEQLEDRLLLSAVPAPYLPDAPMISSGSQQSIGQSATASTDPVISFDGVSDQTLVGNLYAAQGVQFSNATILTSNISLNPVFPPYSGLTIVYNFPGSTIEAKAVGSLWNSVGGYITGNEPIQMVAYASNGSVLGTAGTTGANYYGAGTPNQFLYIPANGIAAVRFIGSTDNTFTLDNFTYTPTQAIYPTSIKWGQYGVPGYQNGVTTYTYEVTTTLTASVPVALYWSPTTTFDSTTAALVNGSQSTIDPTASIGSNTGYVDDSNLIGSPQGTQYLLVVVGDPASGSFDPTQDVMSAQLTLNVTPVYQYQGSWTGPDNDLQDTFLGHSSKDTISSSGCGLTSLVMALGFNGVSTDPYSLDQELTDSSNGYVGKDKMNWGPATNTAASAAGQASIKWVSKTTSSAQGLSDLITQYAQPVIVSVTNPTDGRQHFVLVTGLSGNTFSINDPGYANRLTLDFYGSFQTRGFVQDPNSDQSELYVALDSTNPNLNLALVDSAGNVTGTVPGATTPLGQIPGSTFFTDGPVENLSGQNSDDDTTTQFVYVPKPLGGYQLEISGDGAYTITVTGVTPAGQLTPPLVFSGTSSSSAPTFMPIQFIGNSISDYPPGITSVGGNLYLVGDTAANDQIQITPVGSSNTGSTGVQINGTLNGVNISNTYALTSPSIYFSGTNGNDSVQLASTLTLNTYVSSGGGNNQVVAGGGSTTVVLGSGNNNVQLGNGNDSVALGDGNDNVQLGDGTNSVILGNGSNTLQLGAGNNAVIMGNGNDHVFSLGNGNDSITLGNGNDILKLGSGNDNVQLGDGNNIVFALGNGNDSVTLGNGYNYIILGNGKDSIMAGDGNNNVQLGSGNDTVVMGLGNDNVQGGDGSDSITLGNGSDNVQLGNGADTLLLGNGNDNVQCGNGNDQITLGDGTDSVILGNGDNVAVLGNGNDNVQLGNGNNTAVLGNGDDVVSAGTGLNIIKIGNGYDD